MKLKHWDEASQSWVIDAASNASNLELSNPGFVDEVGNSVSIDHGFTKVYNRLTKLEQNLAWVYINGAVGGGTGGGGTGDVTYTIIVTEGATVYTATDSASMNVTINSGSVKKSFTLTAKNLTTNKIIGTWKIYSLTRTQISLSGLSGTTDIELSAYDSNNNYTTPTYVKVVAGAIALNLQTIPNKTMYIGGIAAVPLNFTVTNNIVNSPAAFVMTVNNIEVAKEVGISTTVRSLSYDARSILFSSGIFNTPEVGQKFTFRAYATTVLSSDTITSNIVTFTVTIAESNNLIIVTEDISDFVPSITPGETYDDLTTFSQGSQIAFNYTLSYGLSKYSTFNVDYSIYLVDGGIETLQASNTILNVTKSESNRFVYNTADIPVNVGGSYIKVVLSGYAVNDPGDISAKYTKTVYCVVVESLEKELRANNIQHTLLAQYSKFNFPNSTTGVWNYPLHTSGDLTYIGAFVSKFPNGVNFVAKDVNGKTNGYVEVDSVNGIPAIRLTGESYGYLEVADNMFPQAELEFGFFQPVGFNISTTFKAEQSSDPKEVILSIGDYEEGELKSGYEICLEEIKVKVGSATSISCKLPQNELLCVDLDVSYSAGAWYFKVYINGVLSAVQRVLQQNIDWKFGKDLYFGCRNDNGVRSKYSNLNIYDIKLYTSSQPDYAIVQNYMSAFEQAQLVNGVVDPNLDTELRRKNLFDSAGNCIIWDYSTNKFFDNDQLYSIFVEKAKTSDEFYPIVLIEETSQAFTLFEAYTTAIFSTDATEAMSKFPAKIRYIEGDKDIIISTPAGVNDANGVSVSLQGTSSLSYTAKNFEIYMGNADETGEKKLLFLPNDEWLPENEFTLKADVMDSAHVNNVAIGKIINGAVKNDQNVSIVPFSPTPPMGEGISDALFPNQEMALDIKSKIRHTSDGFPCLVFIKFAPDKNGNTRQPKFFGIYNFNLGRYAYHNLGLNLLTSYTRPETNLTGPAVITEYTELKNYWNTGVDNGVFSMEINHNDSTRGAFEQDDLKIVKFMADSRFSSRDEETSYLKLQKLYTQLANMITVDTQKYTMDGSRFVELPGQFYTINPAYYTFEVLDQKLNWNNACTYFMLGMIFGTVDSMCKNMTFRSWGGDVWYPTFYDMDTAFGLNNSGQDTVEYWAHLHRWYNIQNQTTGLTESAFQKFYNNSDEFKQYFAIYWSRLWEAIDVLSSRVENNARSTLESIYINLRKNLFPDPDTFIDEHYKGYTDKTGSIIFNYDYNLKYLQIGKSYNPNTGEYTALLNEDADFRQLNFLHGNRVIQVKDWFRRRILFLDSVYGINKNNIATLDTVESPVNTVWAANKVYASPTNKITLNLSANSKIYYHYKYETSGGFWLEEALKSCIVDVPPGDTVAYIYANKYITNFGNFKAYPWTSLPYIDLPLLEELDISGLKNMPASNFFSGGIYNKNTGVGLKSLKRLILSGVELTGASAYTIDVSNCDKLQVLDISNSSITNVTLSDSAVIKTLNLSGTNITSLSLSNQSFLYDLRLDDCNKLLTVTLDNCSKIATLNIPKNVTNVTIKNCESLQSLTLPYNSVNNSISPLVKISVDNCPNLRIFDISGQNNPALVVELVGAKSLESLNIADTNVQSLILPPLYVDGEVWFNTLKSINISRTNTSTLIYNDQTFDYLDLTAFPDLDDIVAMDCKELVKVKCLNNVLNPINLNSSSFYGCSNLTRVIGNYNIKGTEVFKGCSKLIINTPEIYQTFVGDAFITDPNGTNLSIDLSISSLYGSFENCSSITADDFKYIMSKIGSNITSLETTFKNCSNVYVDIWRSFFSRCRNVSILKEAFSGCRIRGTFNSRTSDYNPLDEGTWGILDFLPNLTDAEGAFENNALEWIDNNVFAPKIVNTQTVYSSIAKADNMFRGCTNLQTCVDTNVLTPDPENPAVLSPTKGLLNSETFFTNLRNLIAVYPSEMFARCTKVRMKVINDSNNNTLLFHCINQPVTSLILTSTVYSGITLVGEIMPNVFGGVSKIIYNIDGITPKYYIPTFTSIQYPFTGSAGELKVAISQMGTMFKNIGDTLSQAIGVFTGVKCTETDSRIIPPNIFKGCTKLNSIEAFFNGLDLTNNNQPYVFPPKYIDTDGITEKGMFDDCVNLRIIRSVLNGCTNLKYKLVGEGFKNCQLTDVSFAFSNSGVYGMIPYRLFFMAKNGAILNTINNMSGVFAYCWNLGYSYQRKIDIGTPIGEGLTTSWMDHIVELEGSRERYKLDVTSLVKSYNYDRDENAVIPNPLYTVGGSEPETIVNLNYNPGEYAFDVWYLDGYGWEGAATTEPTLNNGSDLDDVKTRLELKYFIYDAQQKDVILQQNGNTPRYVDTYQNYMIPTDLFRYCSSSCTLNSVLSDLDWNKKILQENLETGAINIIETSIVEGLVGRIPVKLFESLKTSPKFDGVFRNTNFEAFVGLKSDTFERGIMYPPDLFKFNIELTDISNMFYNTAIPVGVDVNPDLFSKLSNLRNVSSVWSNCIFDSRRYNAESVISDQPQFNFNQILAYNLKITNASGLFGVFIIDDKPRGLRLISSDLLQSSTNLNNISNMFYYCKYMVGNVPLFNSLAYPVLNSVTGYLTECIESQITNSDQLEPRLVPASWL